MKQLTAKDKILVDVCIHTKVCITITHIYVCYAINISDNQF